MGSGDATPALVGDKLYVFARQGEDEVTLCLDTRDGKELWRDKYAAQAVNQHVEKHIKTTRRSDPFREHGRLTYRNRHIFQALERTGQIDTGEYTSILAPATLPRILQESSKSAPPLEGWG